jgi:predicted nucleic acid-binding protein
VAGTLRILATAAAKGLVDLPAAILRLRATNFRASEKLIQSFLHQDRDKIR